jgi:multiple sugar transport system substrate-binding protein
MRVPAYCLALIVLGAGITGLTSSKPDPLAIRVAVWGAETEFAEFRKLVVDPIQEKIPRARIRIFHIPSDYYVKLSTLMAAGDAPDLFWLDQDHAPMYAHRGALLDIADRVADDSDPTVDLDDYYTQILSCYRFGDELIGLPWIAQPVVLYANIRLFKESGVSPPTPQWQWDDFLEAARQLTRDYDGDGDIDQWGVALDVAWPPLELFVWQNDGRLIGPDGRKIDLQKEETIAAAEFWRDLIHRHKVAPPLHVVGSDTLAGLFRQEKTAMYLGGAADREDSVPDPRRSQDSDDIMPVELFELPSGPSGTKATLAWHAGLHISSDTADKALAYDVFKALLSGIQHWKIPAPRRTLAANIERIAPRKARSAKVIRRAMESMRAIKPVPRMTEFRTRLGEEFLEPVLTDRMSVRQAADIAAPKIQKVLADR